MGEREGWAQPNGLLPNAVLANEATMVVGVIDSERWLKAEERTAELIACIQPNQPSEDLRNAVADYVQRLISNCFPCQVFTFGSVPLKTYLPDGDIDLTTFSKNENMKETWANLVRETLENEEKDENAEFRVKEVQCIHAEVKIIKCLVENIVVDISFNQLGGLCTLCFLEEVDHLINHNHLFKRSIILIKAWCYYESRILGAHHGLISTYALETLVLYIFHIFNNSFAGPLEVLYRFLQFFSKFDWECFCVSLGGPVPIRLLPEVTAEPPRKDGGELLLSKIFLDACSSVYAVFPGGQDNQGHPFVSKHFNVIDPLRINNNLGRSVSKGNFYRIRSAFAFGAKKLSRLLDCPKDEVHSEVNQFFMNTWDRHGGGNRPDTPRNDLRLRLSKNSEDLHTSGNLENRPSSKTLKENWRDTEIEMNEASCTISPQYGNSHLEGQSKISNQMTPEVRSDQGVHLDKGQRSLEPNNLVNDVEGINPFVRTRSSPELTDSYVDTSSRGRRNRAAESGKIQISAAGFDAIRKNLGPEVFANKKTKSSVDDPSYVKHIPSRENIDDEAEAVSTSNSYHNNSRLTVLGEEPAPVVGTQGMLQEEQDLVNMMASSIGPGFNEQVHLPMNTASSHFHLPFSQSFLASMGYAQRNFVGMLPSNFPFIDHPWASSMQFPPGMLPSPMTHYYPGMGMSSNHDDLIEADLEKHVAVDLRPGEGGNDVCQESDRGSISSFDLDNGSVEMNHLDDQNPSTSAGTNSSSLRSHGQSSKDKKKLSRENRGSRGEDRSDRIQSTGNQKSDVHSDERTASPRFFRTSSSKSKTSSENSWDGSSVKVSKSVKEKRGRKTVYSEGSGVHENLSHQGDGYDRDWDSLSNNSNELAERSTGPQVLPPLNVQSHNNLSLEPANTSVSDTLISVPPMLLGPGSRPRAMNNSGTVPLRFYPTGPPVPFITMLPYYNFPPETSNRLGEEDGLNSSDSGQNVSSSDGLDKSKWLYISSSVRRVGSLEATEQHRCDILNSDFSSHWQNLQFGRFCQNPRSHVPLLYPSPVAVPPMYLQGHFPWDGPGRPLSTNMNVFTQNYGPRIVPAASLQTLSNRPSVYHRYVDEIPRYRSGTGTYLPIPKVSVGDRRPLGTRRGNYSYDRSGDNHGDQNDREGNWNTTSKTRAAGRNHSQNQAERSSSRMDRLAASENRADRPWTSNRPDVYDSYQSQNGPLRSNPTQSGSSNVAYGMYPVQATNPNGMSSNGPTVMMLYPYDQNAQYGSLAEQLEFGSLGPVDFSGMNQSSHLSEVSQSSEALEEQRFHNNSFQQSSLDQPSSPLTERTR